MSGMFGPVFFDLETTGGAEDDDIIQIGATNEYGQTFCRYILPSKPIPPFVSEMTGFQKSGNQLYYRGSPVQTTSLGKALEDFIGYLRQQNRSVVLIGHDCYNQPDCRFLFRDCRAFNLTHHLRNSVFGFIDSLQMMRVASPGHGQYKLEALAWDILGRNPVSHEAVEDSKTLLNIFRQKNLVSQIGHYVRSFDDVWNDENRRLAAKGIHY